MKPHIHIPKQTLKPRSLQLSHPTHQIFATKSKSNPLNEILLCSLRSFAAKNSVLPVNSVQAPPFTPNSHISRRNRDFQASFTVYFPIHKKCVWRRKPFFLDDISSDWQGCAMISEVVVAKPEHRP